MTLLSSHNISMVIQLIRLTDRYSAYTTWDRTEVNMVLKVWSWSTKNRGSIVQIIY